MSKAATCVARLREIGRHGSAHVAEPDEPDAHARLPSSLVMLGLDPGIQVAHGQSNRVDGRVKRGHDDQKRHYPGPFDMHRLVSRFICAALVALALPAQAADKVVAGTLGGQAPLWPFYIALHKGFLDAAGIDMELNFAPSGSGITQQLTAGSLDVVVSVGLDDPMEAIDRGANLAIIRLIGKTPPYALIAKATVKTIADLRGKTISSGAQVDITTVFLEKMLGANGIKKGEYDMISAGVAAARYAALKAGVADAAMVLPPLNFHAEKDGFHTIGLAHDYAKDIPFTGMAVFVPWAEKHRDVVLRLLDATNKSVAWFDDPSHRQEAVELLVGVGKATPEDAAASYEFLHKIDFFEQSPKVSRARAAEPHRYRDRPRPAGRQAHRRPRRHAGRDRARPVRLRTAARARRSARRSSRPRRGSPRRPNRAASAACGPCPRGARGRPRRNRRAPSRAGSGGIRASAPPRRRPMPQRKLMEHDLEAQRRGPRHRLARFARPISGLVGEARDDGLDALPGEHAVDRRAQRLEQRRAGRRGEAGEHARGVARRCSKRGGQLVEPVMRHEMRREAAIGRIRRAEPRAGERQIKADRGRDRD